MYIWRGKNHRDKRHLLLLGERNWTIASGNEETEDRDDRFRYQQEKQFLLYFRSKVRRLMETYLDTNNGKREIELLKRIMTKDKHMKRKEGNLAEELIQQEQENLRQNVYEVFREYTLYDESRGDEDQLFQDIDRDGLKELLSHLGMSMNEKQFNQYLRKLKFTKQMETINFDTFYEGFLRDLDEKNQRRRKWFKLWTLAGQRLKKVAVVNALSTEELLEQQEADRVAEEQALNVSWHLQEYLMRIEAKRLLVDHAVAQAERLALAEYRLAHPPKRALVCEQCQQAWPDVATWKAHYEDSAWHADWVRRKLQDEERFALIDDQLMHGDRGRQLKAYRLVFSPELGLQEMRVGRARLDPHRPLTFDPENKRHKQLVKGMLVQGFDAKQGIRSQYRRFDGLRRQHLIPLHHQPDPNNLLADHSGSQRSADLSTLLLDLMYYCHKSSIDVVRTHAPLDSSVPYSHIANVHFEWDGFAVSKVEIMGEFTGWKPREMACDTMTARYFYDIQLSPGCYRYRFLIDGKEMVSTSASIVEPDVTSSIGKNNIVRVILAPPPRKALQSIALDSPSFSLPETSKFVSRSLASSEVPLAEIDRIHHMDAEENEAIRQRLQDINLRNTNLCDDGAWTFAEHLHPNDLIRTLDVSFNSISDEGMQAMGGGAARCSALVGFRANGNGFAMDGCRYLTTGLQGLNQLQHLELSDNRIGNDGAEVIAGFLTHHRTLQTLHLDSCLIGDDGLQEIEQAMLRNRVLTLLSLQNNLFTSSGVRFLGNVIKCNCALTSLNLSYNTIEAIGAQFLGDALYSNDTLTSLQLVNCQLNSTKTSAAVTALCAGLRKNHSLTHLDLRLNQLVDNYLFDVAEMLQENWMLKSIDLSNNPIKSPDWFHPEKTIETVMLTQIPSIAMSLRRNVRHERDHPPSPKHPLERPPETDIGEWTRHRTWRRLVQKEFVADNHFDIEATEALRLEREYVEGKMARIMSNYKYYLEESACQKFIRALAQMIYAYFRDLPSVPRQQCKELLKAYVQQMNRFLYLQHQPGGLDNVPAPPISGEHDWIGVASPPASAPSSPTTTTRRSKKKHRRLMRNAVASSVVPTKQEEDREEEDWNEDDEALNDFQLSKSGRVVSLSARRRQVFRFRPPSATDESTSKQLNDTLWMYLHMSVTATVFSHLGASHSHQPVALSIHPDRLQQAMLMLTLPLSTTAELQQATDHTLVHSHSHKPPKHRSTSPTGGTSSKYLIPGRNNPKNFSIDWLAFLVYVVDHMQEIHAAHAFERQRLIAGTWLDLPIAEAKALILQFLYSCAYVEVLHEYRSEEQTMPARSYHGKKEEDVSFNAGKPMICWYCQRRFGTKKSFLDHMKATGDAANHHADRPLSPYRGVPFTSASTLAGVHREYTLYQCIHYAQKFILRHLQQQLFQTTFPAYYQLEKKLPVDYYPQVLDMMGAGGRPIGVVEAKQTIRAVDCLGEYLLVVLRSNRKGWVRYTWDNGQQLLHPLPGFDWSKLVIYDDDDELEADDVDEATVDGGDRAVGVWYRVNDNLPPHIELKVRAQPYADAEVLGKLRRGQMVQCLAIIESWLQIKYEEELVAWVLCRVPATIDASSKSDAQDLPLLQRYLRKMMWFSGSSESKDNQVIPAATPSLQSSASVIVRQRRIAANGTEPMPVLGDENAPDRIDRRFSDSVATYEFEGQTYRVNLKRHPELSRRKIKVFDLLRYGQHPVTSADHLLPMPRLITRHWSNTGVSLPSPTSIEQKALFQAIIDEQDGSWARYLRRYYERLDKLSAAPIAI